MWGALGGPAAGSRQRSRPDVSRCRPAAAGRPSLPRRADPPGTCGPLWADAAPASSPGRAHEPGGCCTPPAPLVSTRPAPAFTPFRPSLSRCTPTTFRLPMEKKPGGLAHAHTVCLALLKTGASHCEGDVFVYRKPRPWVKAGLYSLKSESRSYFRGPEAPQMTAGDSGRLLPSRRMAVLILGTVFDRLSQLIGQ